MYADEAKIYNMVSFTNQNITPVQTSIDESVEKANDWVMFFRFTIDWFLSLSIWSFEIVFLNVVTYKFKDLKDSFTRNMA